MKNSKNIKLYIWVFFGAFTAALIAYAINGIYPFGSLSILTSDLRSQYADVTAAFVRRLKSNDNVFLTWSGGLGTNLYAAAVYVMSSPFSLLFLLFDPKYFQDIYFLIILLKIGLTALCFSVYAANSNILKLSSKRMNFVFSLCYGLAISTLKATHNPMWLENMALLPLVFLGVERIMERKKPALFLVTFSLCMITNYYLAYMSGIFTLIYFIYFCIIKQPDKKTLFRSFVCCGIFTIVSIGISSVVLYPSLQAVLNGYTQISGAGYDNTIIKFVPKDILFAFTHIISRETASGYPNAYFSLFALWLSLAYFINNTIPKKQRIASGIIVLFFALSLLFEPLYLAWHFFREPTGFDGRFLYGTVLFMLIFAIQGFENFEKGVNKKHFIVLGIIIFICANYSILGRTNSYYMLSICALLVLTLLYGYMLVKGKSRKILAVMVIAELFIGFSNGVRIIKIWDTYAPHNEYTVFATQYKDNFAALKEYDSSFYRCDSDTIKPYNTPMASDYNGIETYTSLANQKTIDTMGKLGITTLYDNKVLVTLGHNIVTDSLFNVKYTGITDINSKTKDTAGRTIYGNNLSLTDNKNYRPVLNKGNSVFFENTKVFPLMFPVSDNMKDTVLEDNDYFKNQEIFFGNMFGENVKLYTKYSFDSINAINCKAQADKNNLLHISLTALPQDKTIAETPEETAIVNMRFTVKEDGCYYTVLDGEFSDKAIVSRQCGYSVNGTNLSILKMDKELKDLGRFKKGDVIDITYSCILDTDIYIPDLYRLDEKAFENLSREANSESMTNIREENKLLLADCNTENESLIFSSISYDKGFSVKIDGSETETMNISGGFLGFRVPQGKHNIEISYVSPGFKEGAVASGVSLIIGIALIFLPKKTQDEIII